jgi:hypothetical protein
MTGGLRRIRAGRAGDLAGPVAVLTILSLLVAAPLSRAEDEQERPSLPPPKTWHATAYVRGRIGLRVIDYWSQGPDMRARTLIAGHPITTLVRGDRYVVVDELTGRGVDIRRSKQALAADRRRTRPFAFELDELIADGGEKIENVKIGSIDAEIWRVTDGAGRRKIWLKADDPRVPLRVETFNRAAADTLDLDYTNWIFDLELPPQFFATPQGIAIERFEYEVFLERAGNGTAPNLPVLYPDLLHGSPAR